jgi:hypothetical protein
MLSGDGDETFLHEISHFLNAKECSQRGTEHDPSFNALNAPDFIYGKSQFDIGYDVMESYSASAIKEDEANTGKLFLNGVDPQILEDKTTPVYKKLVYLMARLERYIPGVTAYFHAISVPQETNPTVASGVVLPPGIIHLPGLKNSFNFSK